MLLVRVLPNSVHDGASGGNSRLQFEIVNTFEQLEGGIRSLKSKPKWESGGRVGCSESADRSDRGGKESEIAVAGCAFNSERGIQLTV